MIISVTIDATCEAVWASLEEIGSHVEWMKDAESIRFTTASRKGVGTVFECATRVGPIRLTDVMSVTEWVPGQAMGVAHRGVVRGTGRFSLEPVTSNGKGATRLSWRENLRFPWWLGGPVGEHLARPVLRGIWRGNLVRLKRLVEKT